MIEPLLQAERLLIVGMLEQAEQIYRRVAEQDPRNAIALVGLARVALERGDEQAALTHARSALQIDPENAAALRLEARLSEVLAARRSPGEAGSTGQPAGWESTAPVPGGPPSPGPRSSPGPDPRPAEPTPAADARPSEQVVFTRNPSMADHRRQEQQETNRPEPTASPASVPRRGGLLERLFGRHKRGG